MQPAKHDGRGPGTPGPLQRSDVWTRFKKRDGGGGHEGHRNRPHCLLTPLRSLVLGNPCTLNPTLVGVCCGARLEEVDQKGFAVVGRKDLFVRALARKKSMLTQRGRPERPKLATRNVPHSSLSWDVRGSCQSAAHAEHFAAVLRGPIPMRNQRNATHEWFGVICFPSVEPGIHEIPMP